ncbi:conserved hypothetical protein [Tenacibaculum litopenaei]|uniref:hypothetical protein n=1 Tax=Tenacibaculum litopenaei TaxID=396016 RepID=UPI003892EE62
MQSIWKFLQYGYLVVGIIFLVEGIIALSTDVTRAMIMFGLSVFIVVIFLFKRRFRRKIEARNKQQ